MSAAPAPITIPAGTITVTLATTDALVAGKQMRTMAHSDRCGCPKGNELFARVGGQLWAAALAEAPSAAVAAPTPPVDDDRHYLVFELRGKRVQDGPYHWNTAVGERVVLLDLMRLGIEQIEIVPAADIEVR